MSLALKSKQYEFLNQVSFFILSPWKVIYHLPQCPHAVTVQQMLQQIIPSLLFPPFEFAITWTGNLFFSPMNNVSLSVPWGSLDIVFLICSFIWLHLNIIKKKQAQRVGPHPYFKPSHINHQFIRSLVFVFARFNNSYNRWESPPNSVFIIRVPSTEIPTIPCFFIQCQQLTVFQSQMWCQFQ